MPDQVLDMSFPMFQAVIDGYQEHLFDLKCLTVYIGYWTGHYNNAKKPKPLSKVLHQLLVEHKKEKKKQQVGKVDKPAVDVEEFLRRESYFKARMNRGEMSGSGERLL